MSNHFTSKNIFIYLLIFILTIICYHNFYLQQFLYWDDKAYIMVNPYIHGFTLENISWIFTHWELGNWHPLTSSLFALTYELFGENAAAFKFINLCIHSFNSFLIYLLFIIILRFYDPLIKENNTSLHLAGIVTGIAFAIHPLHVESVIWIAETKDTLSTFFYLLTIYLYLKKDPLDKHSLPVLFTFFLALLSKPMAITLPAILVILDLYLLKKPALYQDFFHTLWQSMRQKWAFFLLSLFITLLTFYTQNLLTFFTQKQNTEQTILTERVINALYGLQHYLTGLIYPADITPFYPYSNTFTPSMPVVILFFTLFMSITIIALKSTQSRFTPLACVWLTFLIILLPVIGLVKIGYQSWADRYTYLSTIGYFLLFGWIIFTLLNQLSKNKKIPLLFFIIFIFSQWGYLTYLYTDVWKNDRTLWLFSSSKYPNAIAYRNLASSYYIEKNYPATIYYALQSLSYNPAHVTTLHMIADAYKALNNTAKELYYYQLAVTRNPESGYALTKLGDYFYYQGVHTKAIFYYNTALKIAANAADIYHPLQRLAYLDYEQHHYQSALQKILLAYQKAPKNFGDQDTLQLIAELYFILHNQQQFTHFYKKLRKIAPHHSYIKLRQQHVRE